MKRKTIYSAIAALTAAGTLVAAQPSATQQPGQQQMQQPGQQQPGQQSAQQQSQPSGALILQEGFIKQGNNIFKVQRVTKATKVEDLKADEKGHITKNGKKIELQDGQMVNPQGEVSQAPGGGGGAQPQQMPPGGMPQQR